MTFQANAHLVSNSSIQFSPKVVHNARIGQLYALLSLKDQLLALEPEAGFTILADALGYSRSASLQQAHVRSMKAVAQAKARFYNESAPSGEAVICDAPKTVGDGGERALRWRSRACYVACFEQARIRGRSQLIELADEVLLDFEDWEHSEVDDRLALDPAIFRSDGDLAWVVRGNVCGKVRRIERGFMLTGIHTRAFGHWMWEFLPKYLSALDSGCLPPLSVLIDEGMPDTHRQLLERVLPGGSEIVEVGLLESVDVDELWCAPSLCYMPLCPEENHKYRPDIYAASPARFMSVMRRLNAAYPMPAPSGEPDRLFIARRSTHRRLDNSEVIEGIATNYGFQVVDPESLDFSAQVAKVRSARFIVAPEGSALYLLFLAVPGTRLAVLNFAENGGQAGFTALIEAAGIDATILYGPALEVRGDRAHFSDYQVDPGLFTRFLDRWLAREDLAQGE